MVKLYVWKRDEDFFASLQSLSFFINTYVPFSDSLSNIAIVPEISYNTLLVLDNKSKAHDFYFWSKEIITQNLESGVSFKILIPREIPDEVNRALKDLSEHFQVDIFHMDGHVYAKNASEIPQDYKKISSIILDFNLDLNILNSLLTKIYSLEFLGMRLDFLDALTAKNEVLFFDCDRKLFVSKNLDEYVKISEERISMLDSFTGEKSILASIYPILISYAKSDDKRTKKLILNHLSLIELYVAFDL